MIRRPPRPTRTYTLLPYTTLFRAKEERLRPGACRGGTDLPDCAPSRHAPIRMRLNKHISDTGFCSRREADRLIGEGRVTVNGQRARIGAEVGEGDEVKVDGQALRARSAAKGQRRHVYIALTKPVGTTCKSGRAHTSELQSLMR